MNKEDIQHLSDLARIKITEEEAETFSKNISDILSYVSVIKEIANEELTPQVGARYNILRKDEVLNEAGSFTKDILKAMPKTENNFLVVKKILNTDSE